MEIISEVHFYQGVKFGGSVIKFIALDSALSDARLHRGNKAKIDAGIGVRVYNEGTGEKVTVPFNNVAFVRWLEVDEQAKESKKSK